MEFIQYCVGDFKSRLLMYSYLQTCKVRAFALKEQPTTTAFEITFEESVIARDKMLETIK